MKLRFRQPSTAEVRGNADPYSFFDVTAEALVRRVGGRPGTPGLFPGFVTGRRGDAIFIAKYTTPSVGEEVTLQRAADGTWNYGHSFWRPGSEFEAHTGLIRKTSLRPVSPEVTGLHETEVCYRLNDGSLQTQTVLGAEVLPPLEPQDCENVAQTLQLILQSARG